MFCVFDLGNKGDAMNEGVHSNNARGLVVTLTGTLPVMNKY